MLIFLLLFRINKKNRNLYVVCFILATGQIFSLEGGGHKYVYNNKTINNVI
jgi:hypothetical protein